jgi:hypothetical protein
MKPDLVMAEWHTSFVRGKLKKSGPVIWAKDSTASSGIRLRRVATPEKKTWLKESSPTASICPKSPAIARGRSQYLPSENALTKAWHAAPKLAPGIRPRGAGSLKGLRIRFSFHGVTVF